MCSSTSLPIPCRPHQHTRAGAATQASSSLVGTRATSGSSPPSRALSVLIIIAHLRFSTRSQLHLSSPPSGVRPPPSPISSSHASFCLPCSSPAISQLDVASISTPLINKKREFRPLRARPTRSLTLDEGEDEVPRRSRGPRRLACLKVDAALSPSFHPLLLTPKTSTAAFNFNAVLHQLS